MINKKLIIIMIVLIVVIIGVGIGGYIMLSKKNKILLTNNVPNSIVVPGGQLLPKTENNGNSVADGQPIIKKEMTQKDKDELMVSNLANFFVAMLGSYSSDAHFKNIIDLKSMMTAKMQTWANEFIKRNLDNTSNKNESITTKVFSSEVLSNTTNKMKILVKTRRSSVSGETSTMYNQDATVMLDKIGDNWLVDTVEWK